MEQDLMTKVLNSFDKALSKLPFDGNKTNISAALKVAFPILALKFPFLLFTAPIIDGLTSIGIGVGLVHKGIKAVKAKEDFNDKESGV